MMANRPYRHYQQTKVPESQSLLDIESLLRRHGIDTVRWTTGPYLICIEFLWPYGGQKIGFRLDVKVPSKDVDGFTLIDAIRDQERRRLLRVLLNHVKAKLVAVEDGLVDLLQEFLPYLITAGGRTAGEVAAEELVCALQDGRLPDVRLLPPGNREVRQG